MHFIINKENIQMEKSNNSKIKRFNVILPYELWKFLKDQSALTEKSVKDILVDLIKNHEKECK